MKKNNLFALAASPESLGIPSSAIAGFLEHIEREQICLHGFLLLRNGQLAAEGYWTPYSQNSMHRMYSVSKSFVSLAIGLMIDEGKIRLDDQVVQFFEDKIPPDTHAYLAQATIRDLLMMSTPHSTNSYTNLDHDWAATFFNRAPSHPPGTIFSYDTAATVILGTIVERISGVPFLEYMREPLLDPIGFSKDAWCIETPEGTSWGGSGVICTLRDMAKIAYVCLNQGRWNDVQLISENYIRAATSKQVDNSLFEYDGYGYHIWIEQDNGFYFSGMGSQFAFCYPDKGLIFACISDTQGSHMTQASFMKVFREEILSKIQDFPLDDDPRTHSTLNRQIGQLQILPQRGHVMSSFEQKVDGKWYSLDENPMGISRTRFEFSEDEGIWEYENASGEHQLTFGKGKKVAGSFPQSNYYGKRIGTPSVRGYDCLSSAAWVEEHKLNMLVYLTDIHLGTLKITFSFKRNEISIHMVKAAEWFLEEYSGFAGGHSEEIGTQI